jgi:glycerol-3-phosphate acyltransferase PlsX
MVKIALDAFGSDNAPNPEILGAVEELKSDNNLEVILVGDEKILSETIGKLDCSDAVLKRLKISNASEQITMKDSPSSIVRNKRDSSLRIAYELVHSKEADAVLSAGNTGASLAIAMFVLKRLKGIDRPAIATVMPSVGGHTVLLDAGANVDVKPYHLAQFAIMGSEYASFIKRIDTPIVGLLSNGEEESKGNELTREAFKIIKKIDINFLGYVEGREIFNGKADVVVCDGFTGNVILKSSETLAETIFKLLREEVNKSIMAKLGVLLASKALKNFKKLVDHNEYGGAPLLGINGVGFIAHGGASPKAIASGIRMAKRFVEQEINLKISEKIELNVEAINNNKEAKIA